MWSPGLSGNFTPSCALALPGGSADRRPPMRRAGGESRHNEIQGRREAQRPRPDARRRCSPVPSMLAAADRSTMMQDNADFYTRIAVFTDFAGVMDPARYRSLPDDWLIGLTDVEHSTRAIEAGRYKAVNTAGASAIAAVTNALAGRPFPFVFGGDGASLAVSSARRSVRARRARGDRGVVARRARPDAPRGAGSRFRRPGAGSGRRGRAVRGVGERLVRDVLRRRARLGRARDEGRAIRRGAVGARESVPTFRACRAGGTTFRRRAA